MLAFDLAKLFILPLCRPSANPQTVYLTFEISYTGCTFIVPARGLLVLASEIWMIELRDFVPKFFSLYHQAAAANEHENRRVSVAAQKRRSLTGTSIGTRYYTAL